MLDSYSPMPPGNSSCSFLKSQVSSGSISLLLEEFAVSISLEQIFWQQILFVFFQVQVYLFFIKIFFFSFFWLPPQHMEVSGPGVESKPELQPTPQLQ